jgi:hypothetical protein
MQAQAQCRLAARLQLQVQLERQQKTGSTTGLAYYDAGRCYFLM